MYIYNYGEGKSAGYSTVVRLSTIIIGSVVVWLLHFLAYVDISRKYFYMIIGSSRPSLKKALQVCRDPLKMSNVHLTFCLVGHSHVC